MARYLGSLAFGLLTTSAVVAALWWGAPRLVGERPPAGLMGMLAGIGTVLSLGVARRTLPPADRDREPG